MAGGTARGISVPRCWEAGRGLGSRTPNLGAVTDRPDRGVSVPAARTDWGAGVWDVLFVQGHVHVRPLSALPGPAARTRVYPSAGFSERAPGPWRVRRVIPSVAGSFLTLLVTPVAVCAGARLGSACGFSFLRFAEFTPLCWCVRVCMRVRA